MRSFWQDSRYGLRQSLRSPVFTAVAVLTVALGVGANTAIFSFVNALLLRPLEGAHDPAALVQLLQISDDRVNDAVSYLDWLDYREQNSSFAGMAMYDGVSFSLSVGQEAERIEGAMVTGDYFETLGVKAVVGRLIAPDDARTEGASPVVALSHNIWRNRFGGDPLIVCVRTLQNARAIPTGFDVERALTARIDLGRQNYSEEQGREFYQRLIERMEAIPGVEAAGLAPYVPLSGPQPVTRIHPEGREPETGRMQVGFNFITPRYLEAVGIQLLKGRRFSAQDDRRSPMAAVINEALARRYWPNEDLLGKRFRFGVSNPDKPLIEIVGVASDTKTANLFAPPRMYVYLPMAQHYQNQAVLHLRTSGQPERLVPAMRREIAMLDRSLPVYEIKTLTRYRDDALTAQRLAAYLISGFGVLAMALAAIGLYGRMSYDVERRRREIGIRMALGAQPRDALRLIVRQGMTLTLIGVAVGLITAFVATRLIKGLLFGVSATDPLTFLMIASLLTVTAGLACYIPARRATNVDPIKSLRYE